MSSQSETTRIGTKSVTLCPKLFFLTWATSPVNGAKFFSHTLTIFFYDPSASADRVFVTKGDVTISKTNMESLF